MSHIIYPEEALVLAGCALDCSECLAGRYVPRNFPPHKKWSSPTQWCDEPEPKSPSTEEVPSIDPLTHREDEVPNLVSPF